MSVRRLLLSILAVVGAAVAGPASAQTWTVPPGPLQVFTAPSIAGEPTGPLAIRCGEGQLTMEVVDGLGIDALSSRGDAATIVVDGRRFPTKADHDGHGSAILVPSAALPALKAGRRMEIAYPSYDRTVRATFPLTGSRKALDRLEAGCGLSRASAAPASPGAPAGQEAGDIQRLQIKVAEELTRECRDIGGQNIIFDRGAVRTEGGDPAHPDVVFNFHHILCNGADSALMVTGVGYCGAGPCLQRRYAYQSGRYVPAGEFYQ